MTQSLASRLTDLLDVIQAVDGCRRIEAAQRVALACRVSPRYVTSLATGAVLVRRHSRLNAVALLELESVYRHEMTLLRAFKLACANAWMRGA